MQTRIQGLSTHYIDLPGEKGPVLFLHGWGAHIGLYQPVFDLLQQQGYRVVAFDMPGVGGTESESASRPRTVRVPVASMFVKIRDCPASASSCGVQLFSA